MTEGVLPAEFRNYCEFGDERVYLLLAIARAKENADIKSSDAPTVRKVVHDSEELSRKADELAHAVGRFDQRYRLYLSANARDTVSALFELREGMDDWLRMALAGDEDIKRKFGRVDSEFKSVLQSDTCKAETNFIFDVDDATEAEAQTLREELAAETTILLVQETPNGYHIVTEPFNYTELESSVEYEHKTDGMIFVSYIGE